MERLRLSIVALCLCALTAPAAGDDPDAPSSDPLSESFPLNVSLDFDLAAPAWRLDDPDAAARNGADDPFNAGSWVFQTYGSATVFNDNDGVPYLSHTGVGYFIIDNLSINAEVVAGGIDSKDSREDDGYALGMDLMVRWHGIRDEDWSIFAELGAGLLWSQNPFPAGGTHQNFTPQAGLGAMVHLFDNLYLMGGVRWHHLSNARKHGIDRNPGFDAGMFYAGIMIPF